MIPTPNTMLQLMVTKSVRVLAGKRARKNSIEMKPGITYRTNWTMSEKFTFCFYEDYLRFFEVDPLLPEEGVLGPFTIGGCPWGRGRS